MEINVGKVFDDIEVGDDEDMIEMFFEEFKDMSKIMEMVLVEDRDVFVQHKKITSGLRRHHIPDDFHRHIGHQSFHPSQKQIG